MFRDGLAYGIGPLVAGWKVVRGRRVVKQEETFKTKLAKLFKLGAPRKAVVPSIFYEGGDLINLDPYLILPDTNVPIHKVGEGEFFGWIDSESFQGLLKEENQVDSSYFNIKYLASMKERMTEFTIDPSRRGYAYGMNQRKQLGNVTNNKTIVNMYIDLIPNDWELGSAKNPEKWLFRVTDSEIIISAEPVNLVHDQYPVVIAAPDYDGYSVSPVSRIEMIYGLQEVLNFLFNSHMANVRRSVNNMFIADPSLVNMPDFENPEGGLLIRLRRAAWGRGVANAVEQLKVTDITRNNISEAFSIMGMIQRTSGANDNAMGIMREGSERRSATEAQGALSATAGRMERLGKLFSAQAMQPLSYLLGFHTQQLMTKETYVKVLGEWTQRLQIEYGSKVKVDPLDLLVEFDVIPRDGSLPVDTKGMLDFWNLALQTISKSPELLQQIDTARVFMHMARLSGAKDVQDFIKQQQENPQQPAQVQPNEEVAQQAQAGNLVPAPQAMAAMGQEQEMPTGMGASLGMMQ
jgi:hypothetical protein